MNHRITLFDSLVTEFQPFWIYAKQVFATFFFTFWRKAEIGQRECVPMIDRLHRGVPLQEIPHHGDLTFDIAYSNTVLVWMASEASWWRAIQEYPENITCIHEQKVWESLKVYNLCHIDWFIIIHISFQDFCFNSFLTSLPISTDLELQYRQYTQIS